MRLTGLGKFVILLLAVGFAIGGYRMYSQSKTGGGGNGGFKVPSIPGLASATKAPNNANSSGQNNGGTNSGSTGGNTGGNTGSTGGVPTVADSPNQVTLVTSKSQKTWLGDQIDKFNARGGTMKVVPQYVETREAMHGILKEQIKPVIYCPSTTIWTQRLQTAWAESHPGGSIVSLDDPASYRVYLRTPLVFVTTQQKARFLRPILGRSGSWQKLRELGLGRPRPPWGEWKWTHADPISANSGMMTLGAILADYAESSGQSGDYATVAQSARFRSFVKEGARGLRFDLPAQSGSSALFAAWVKDPNRYDVPHHLRKQRAGGRARQPEPRSHLPAAHGCLRIRRRCFVGPVGFARAEEGRAGIPGLPRHARIAARRCPQRLAPNFLAQFGVAIAPVEPARPGLQPDVFLGRPATV
jgi:hypothetical protein